MTIGERRVKPWKNTGIFSSRPMPRGLRRFLNPEASKTFRILGSIICFSYRGALKDAVVWLRRQGLGK